MKKKTNIHKNERMPHYDGKSYEEAVKHRIDLDQDSSIRPYDLENEHYDVEELEDRIDEGILMYGMAHNSRKRYR